MDEVEDGEILDGQEAQFSQISQSSDEGNGEKSKGGVDGDPPCAQRKKKKKTRQWQRHKTINNQGDYDDEEDVQYVKEARQGRTKHVDDGVHRSRWDLSFQLRRGNRTQTKRFPSDHGRYSERSSVIRRNSDGMEGSRTKKRRHFSTEEWSRSNRSYSSGSHSTSHAAQNRRKSAHVSPEIDNSSYKERMQKKRHENTSGAGRLKTSASNAKKRKTKKQTNRKEGFKRKEGNQDTPTLAKADTEISRTSKSSVCSNQSSSLGFQANVNGDDVIILPVEPKNVPLIDLVSDAEEEGDCSSSRDGAALNGSDSLVDDVETATDSAHDSWEAKDDSPNVLNGHESEESPKVNNQESYFIPTFQEIPPEKDLECVTDENISPLHIPYYLPEDDPEELVELELRRVALEGLLNRVGDNRPDIYTPHAWEKEITNHATEFDNLAEVARKAVAETRNHKNRACDDTTINEKRLMAPNPTAEIQNALIRQESVVAENQSVQSHSTKTTESTEVKSPSKSSTPVGTDLAEPILAVEISNVPPTKPASTAPENGVNEDSEDNEEELELSLLRQKLLMDMKKKKCMPVKRSVQVLDSTLAINPKKKKSAAVLDSTSNVNSKTNQNAPMLDSTSNFNPKIKKASLMLNSTSAVNPKKKKCVPVPVLDSNSAINPKKKKVAPGMRTVQVLDSTLAINVMAGYEQSWYRKRTKVNRKAVDPFTIKRTIVNNLATSPYLTPLKSDHRAAKRTVSSPSKQGRIVISVRPDDTSEDEDEEVSDAESSAVAPNNVTNPSNEAPNQVELPQSFHTSLDSFLRSVRESASKFQKSSENSASSDGVNKEIPHPSPPVSLTDVVVDVDHHHSPKPTEDLDTLEEIRRSQSEWLEVEGVSTTDDDISENEVEEGLARFHRNSAAIGSRQDSTNLLEENRLKNEGIRNQGASVRCTDCPTPDVPVALPAAEARIVNSPQDASTNNTLMQSGETGLSLSNADDTISDAFTAELKLVPIPPGVKKRAKAKLQLKNRAHRPLKPASRSLSHVIPSQSKNYARDAERQKKIKEKEELEFRERTLREEIAKNNELQKIKEREELELRERIRREEIAKIKEQQKIKEKEEHELRERIRKEEIAKNKELEKIKEKEELELRERALREKIAKNKEQLNLSNKESELVKLREKASGLMGEALAGMVIHEEKKKLCTILEKKADELRQQLARAEKAIAKANEQRENQRREIFVTVEEAFKTRSKSIKLSGECRSLGIKFMGENYKLPKKGAKELAQKIRSVYSNSMQGKELDATKGLILASKEIYGVWNTGEPYSIPHKSDINDGNTNPEEEQAGNYRVMKFVLNYDRKSCIAVPPTYHPYQSVLKSHRLRNGWKNESIVCKLLSSKVCSKPTCAFQHID